MEEAEAAGGRRFIKREHMPEGDDDEADQPGPSVKREGGLKMEEDEDDEPGPSEPPIKEEPMD